jgi:hypothetical protein
VLLLFSSFAFCSCRTLRFDKPLKNYNFKENNWLFLYEEKKEGDYGQESERKLWLTEDENLLDSLKEELQCVVSKQSDCLTCYTFLLAKDHVYFDSYLFDNKKYISLGRLKSSLFRVTPFEISSRNVQQARAVCDSLKMLLIPFIINQNLDQPYQYTFKLKLTLDNVNDTSFFTGVQKRNWQNRYDHAAKDEMLKIYPELSREQIFVFGAGIYYSMIIQCNSDFKFDPAKLKGNKVIRYYEVEGLQEKPYVITLFRKT